MAENKRQVLKSTCLRIVLILFSVVTQQPCFAQHQDTTTINRQRLTKFVLISSTAYGVTLVGLNSLWYTNSPHQSFRFFNDNDEWKQVDKVGHFTSAFYLSYGTSSALKWCNLPAKKSNFIGAVTGFLILVPVEIFDGFSQAYGASSGDLIADAAGSSFFLGQQLLWNDIRISPKFSFHQTRYAASRPSVLGDNTLSEILKDYNGQTYWLSADIDKFIRFPRWLNLAVGYGAQQMVYARDTQNRYLGYTPFRQYYLSLDFDLRAIRTRSKVLKTMIFIASIIKLPAPTLEFSRKKIVFHPLYF
jgi:hypothetical protein